MHVGERERESGGYEGGPTLCSAIYELDLMASNGGKPIISNSRKIVGFMGNHGGSEVEIPIEIRIEYLQFSELVQIVVCAQISLISRQAELCLIFHAPKFNSKLQI